MSAMDFAPPMNCKDDVESPAAGDSGALGYLRAGVGSLQKYLEIADVDSRPPVVVWKIVTLLERLIWLEERSASGPEPAEMGEDQGGVPTIESLSFANSVSMALSGVEDSFLSLDTSSASPTDAALKQLGQQLRLRTGYVSYKGYVCARVLANNVAAAEAGAPVIQTWFQPEKPEESGVCSAKIMEDGGDEGTRVEFELYVESDSLEITPWHQHVAFDPRQKSDCRSYNVTQPDEGRGRHVIWIEAVHCGLNRHVQTLRIELPRMAAPKDRNL